MFKYLISFVILLIAASFVILEIFTNSGNSYVNEVNSVSYSEASINNVDTTDATQNGNVPAIDSFLPVDDLVNSGVVVTNGQFGVSLFKHASVNPSSDKFYLVGFDFSYDGNSLGKVTSIISTEDLDSANLFNKVKVKLIDSIDGTNGIEITDNFNTVQDENFYLNDSNAFSDTTFLIARSSNKVLAFEYPKKYHKQIKEFINVFFM